MSSESWGYENPSAKGPNVFHFFTWDLSRVIEEGLLKSTRSSLQIDLMGVQHAVNDLISRYAQLDPDNFEGQEIVFSVAELERESYPVIVMRTTEPLENRILDFHQHVRPGHC